MNCYWYMVHGGLQFLLLVFSAKNVGAQLSLAILSLRVDDYSW